MYCKPDRAVEGQSLLLRFRKLGNLFNSSRAKILLIVNNRLLVICKASVGFLLGSKESLVRLG